jgi:hypothetical protein
MLRCRRGRCRYAGQGFLQGEPLPLYVPGACLKVPTTTASPGNESDAGVVVSFVSVTALLRYEDCGQP